MSDIYFQEKIPSAYEGMRKLSKTGNKDLGFVVHDLYHREKDATVGFWDRLKENRWLKKGIVSNGQVTVLSEHTKNALVRTFPGAAGKVRVVKPNAEEAYRPTDEDARDSIRYQYTKGDAYFLYRGPIHPAAQIINLLKGFSIFKKRIGSNMKLVLCGPQGSYSTSILADIETYKYREDLVWMSNPSAWEEESILCSTYALVHPCRWERFGIPVLNAMKSGIAVLTTEDSAMSEYCGAAGMYFNEKDPADIGEKLIRIYNDEQMRSEMIGTGLL